MKVKHVRQRTPRSLRSRRKGRVRPLERELPWCQPRPHPHCEVGWHRQAFLRGLCISA